MRWRSVPSRANCRTAVSTRRANNESSPPKSRLAASLRNISSAWLTFTRWATTPPQPASWPAATQPADRSRSRCSSCTREEALMAKAVWSLTRSAWTPRDTLVAMPTAATTVNATSGITSTAISLDRICMFLIMC
jgi:hypothetical protein